MIDWNQLWLWALAPFILMCIAAWCVLCFGAFALLVGGVQILWEWYRR